jgi:hypothetical protein
MGKLLCGEHQNRRRFHGKDGGAGPLFHMNFFSGNARHSDG